MQNVTQIKLSLNFGLRSSLVFQQSSLPTPRRARWRLRPQRKCRPPQAPPPAPPPPSFASLCHQSFFTFSSPFLSARLQASHFSAFALRLCPVPASSRSPHRQRVIHLHWPRRMCCFDSRGLRRSERKESSNPMTAKTHYRWENTSDHQLQEPIPRSGRQTGGINCHRPPQSRGSLTETRCKVLALNRLLRPESWF